MLRSHFSLLCIPLLLWSAGANSPPAWQAPLLDDGISSFNRTVSPELFYELEELARIVDISYCVGTTGIQKPFSCASRCDDFEGFELVTTWNTGPLLADSCGYIAISHHPFSPRIIVAFRGTYSITNTIIDLSTIPQEYVPYPEDGEINSPHGSILDSLLGSLRHTPRAVDSDAGKCENCTVHLGFMTSWRNTRVEILPHLEKVVKQYPGYQLTLVGHSLGGAVAALAALEFKGRGWRPKITTFGEPRLGNKALMNYIDKAFLSTGTEANTMFRRVTHVDDPVPLLPLKEWGFRMHAGEVYIFKAHLSPAVTDLYHCIGDEDLECIASADPPTAAPANADTEAWLLNSNLTELWNDGKTVLGIPSRLKIWQLFFAHRDYFWRLGLCVPGGDPFDWYRKYPHESGEV